MFKFIDKFLREINNKKLRERNLKVFIRKVERYSKKSPEDAVLILLTMASYLLELGYLRESKILLNKAGFYYEIFSRDMRGIVEDLELELTSRVLRDIFKELGVDEEMIISGEDISKSYIEEAIRCYIYGGNLRRAGRLLKVLIKTKEDLYIYSEYLVIYYLLKGNFRKCLKYARIFKNFNISESRKIRKSIKLNEYFKFYMLNNIINDQMFCGIIIGLCKNWKNKRMLKFLLKKVEILKERKNPIEDPVISLLKEKYNISEEYNVNLKINEMKYHILERTIKKLLKKC